MSTSRILTDEELIRRVEVYKRAGSASAAARELDIDRATLKWTLAKASRLGLFLDHDPAMPGFEITKLSTDPNGRQTITQKIAPGEVSVMPETHFLGKMTVNRDAEGRVIQDWVRYEVDQAQREALMKAAIAAFSSEIPRAEPVTTNLVGSPDLANQYTITDYHFGLLSWREETGADYDLKIAEKLWFDWFAAAVKLSPDAHTGILAQLGDLLHFDGMKAVTPTSGHVLDTDTRFSKMVRTVLRCLRFAIRLLLEKHEQVHIVMADANHDEASEVWLREMFSAHYEHDPRVTVDRSPGTYYAFEWGLTSLFYHHGHRRKIAELGSVFAGRYRELFGRTKFSYGHTGHLHNREVFSDLTGIIVERHPTLAAPSSHESNGGWMSMRGANVITYSKRFGEVGRSTLTPEMVKS